MFKITPVQDYATAESYAALCGITLRDGAFLYSMINTDDSSLMALSQFEILGDFGYIFDIKPVPQLDDFEAMFILGRQTMNFIDMCGAHKCRASKDGADNSLLRAIGFTTDGEEFFCDMSGFFDGSHCSGHSKSI